MVAFFVAFLTIIVHFFVIPNQNHEESIDPQIEPPPPLQEGSPPHLPPGSQPQLQPLNLPVPPQGSPQQQPPPQNEPRMGSPSPAGTPSPSGSPLEPQPPGFSTSSQPHPLRRQRSNPSLNVAPPHPMNLNQVPDPHLMDTLSWTALAYCFTAGLEFNAILAQVANPSNVSFRVKLLSLLLNIALCLLIAANGIFARTHPNMAFVMDRVGSVIVLISSIIAAMPTIPPYVSIIIAVAMIILYVHQKFKGKKIITY